MLFSSHQLDLVEHLCQDVVVVHHGRVVLAGVLEELRAAARRRVIDLAIGNGDGWTSQLGGVEVAERGPGHLRLWATAGGSRVQLRTYPQLASGRTRCGAARSTCCWSTAPSWFGGKILGIGLLALGQLLLVTVAASVTATMVDAVDISRLQPGLVAWLLA